MKDIKVVIGANYGDEGKGLMTDYFANKAKEENKKCIVVLSNGSSQRGHTVETPDGTRHVFHHFGSGALCNADTYASKYFLVNPVIFRQEYEELEKLGIKPKLYVDPSCRVVTVWDMMMNQESEDSLDDNRHGSCGMGVWETIKRSQKAEFNIEVSNLIGTPWMESFAGTSLIYYRSNGGKETDKKMLGSIKDRFIDDLKFFVNHITVSGPSILEEYDSIIFENGQGLAIDQHNLEEYPHVTPSNTGMMNPINILSELFYPDEYDLEACYVTRTYFTRHGAGKFEVDPIDFNIEKDETNVPNDYQGTLRYGKFDAPKFNLRVLKDLNGYCKKVSIAITHINECSKKDIDIYQCINPFVVYKSDGKTRESVSCYYV